jgi:hypothetical protein
MSEGRSVADEFASCGARALIAQSGRCTDAMMDLLYETAAGTIEQHDDAWFREQRERHEKRLAEACAPPGPAALASGAP